ncbi:hypothetical protein ACF0H5_003823 [Mactra antiquata]
MMQNRVISVISKPSNDRRRGEVRVVLPWLRKKSELLSTCNSDVLEDVIKHCNYLRVYKDDVIVVQGDTGDWYVELFI